MADFAPQPNAGGIDLLAVAHAPVLQINRRLYRALARKGWRVELAIPVGIPWISDPAAIQPDHPEDPPIHRLPVKGSYTRTWSFEGLSQLLTARRPRLVYLENEPDSTMAWVIGRWCLRNGAKLIVNTNENDIPPMLEAMRRRRLKPVLRSIRTRLWMLLNRRYVAWAVAISEGGREAMRSIGFENAVTVTPLGFDESLFHPDAARRAELRRRLGLDRPVIAYFGRMSPNKGVHLLIAALGRIRHLDWQFLIDDFAHHSDDYAQQLRSAIEQTGIADRTVSFRAMHDEMPDYMRAADIVAAPSTWHEQYGRVVPEAMACGCTVIVSDMGALPELLGPAGLVVPAGDIEALAESLLELLDDPDRRSALGKAAAERAKKLLSIDRQASLLDALFRQLIAARPQ